MISLKYPLFGITLSLLSLQATAQCIGLITGGGGSDFWQQVTNGAKQAGKELNIPVLARGPLHASNTLRQKQLIEFIIKRGCKSLVLAPISNALNQYIQELKTLNIPTVYIDRDTGGQRVNVIETNNYSAGYQAGLEMVKALNGRGNVAVFAEIKGLTPTDLRARGFIDAAKLGGLNIVINRYVGSNVGEVRKNVSNFFKQFPLPDGIFTPNESTTMGTIATLERLQLSNKILHIGFDGSDYILTALKNQQLYGVMLQHPYKMGYLGVKAAHKAMQGELSQPDIETDLIFVTAENINSDEVKAFLQ